MTGGTDAEKFESCLIAVHDVFPDPKDGGRPPYECIYLPAIQSGDWVEERVEGSLRILRRIS